MSPTRRVLLPFLGRKGGYQRKLLACFLLVSFVLFFPFSLLVLRAADSRYRAELQEMSRRTIAQARNTCDTLLLEVFRYGLESVTGDPDLIRLMYGDTFDAADAVTAQNLLANMQRYNAYVNNIYIINGDGRVLVASDGDLFAADMTDDPLYAAVRAQPDREGSFSFTRPDSGRAAPSTTFRTPTWG